MDRTNERSASAKVDVVRALHVAAAAAVLFGAIPAIGCSVVLGTGDYKFESLTCQNSADKLDPSKRDRMVKACALLVACDPLIPNERISDCITNDTPEMYTYWSGALGAKGCEDILGILGRANAIEGDCPASEVSSKCVDNRAVQCLDTGGPNGWYEDCSIVGGACTTYVDGSATRAGCKVPVSCSGTTTTSQCTSNMLWTCYGGVPIGLDCSRINANCETRSAGTSCYFKSPTCDADGWTCQGDAATGCVEGKQQVSNCASTGLKCLDEGGFVGCAAPVCSLSDAGGCVEHCDADGVTMHICIGGSPSKLDCTSLGFTQCSDMKVNDRITKPWSLCF